MATSSCKPEQNLVVSLMYAFTDGHDVTFGSCDGRRYGILRRRTG